jgi:hypothetical protein
MFVQARGGVRHVLMGVIADVFVCSCFGNFDVFACLLAFLFGRARFQAEVSTIAHDGRTGRILGICK